MVAIQVCDLLHFWRPEAPYRLMKKRLKNKQFNTTLTIE